MRGLFVNRMRALWRTGVLVPVRALFGAFVMFLCTGKAGAQSMSVRVAGGYEQENSSWTIAGNSAGQDPNVLSELKWRAVGGVSGRVDLEGRLWRRWRVFATAGKVWTRRGSMTDTDYGLDNRNDRMYYLWLPVTDGYSAGVDAGIGYQLVDRRDWEVVVYGGYGYAGQDFAITGGGYAQLNSRYDAHWMGPKVRVVASWAPVKRWEVSVDASYSQVVYRATADWNLIPEFSHPVSFRQRADGYGVKGELRVCRGIGKGMGMFGRGKGMGVFGAVNWFDWETGTGIDVLYLQSGGQQQTRLNGAQRNGWGVRAGVEWRF